MEGKKGRKKGRRGTGREGGREGRERKKRRGVGEMKGRVVRTVPNEKKNHSPPATRV